MTEETYGLQDYSDNEAKISTDPVCGMAVMEENAAAELGFWGQMYYFCSDQCKRTFQEHPEKFAGQQG